MILKGILKSFNSTTHQATVQIVGSLTNWLTIPTSHALMSSDMVAGRAVAVLTPDPGKPGESGGIGLWTPSTPPAGVSGDFASVTTGDTTVYVDKAATGAGTGESWTDAFTTIQAAWDSLPDIVAHDVTIKVRKGSTPFREQVECTEKVITGSVQIEGEFYIYGECEAHALGAGEIKDTGAFGDVLVGDHVYMYELGANNRIVNSEVCTVDDVSNKPDRIGTDSATSFNTTAWNYVIVRTELSGSDDGTDGGTARDYNLRSISVNKLYVYGIYMDFSDVNSMGFWDSRYCKVYYCIGENNDNAMAAFSLSDLEVRYSFFSADTYALASYTSSYMDARYIAAESTAGGSKAAVLCARQSGMLFACANIIDGDYGVDCDDLSWTFVSNIVIDAAVGTGLSANLNSAIRKQNVTNNAGTPESTASGGVIA